MDVVAIKRDWTLMSAPSKKRPWNRFLQIILSFCSRKDFKGKKNNKKESKKVKKKKLLIILSKTFIDWNHQPNKSEIGLVYSYFHLGYLLIIFYPFVTQKIGVLLKNVILTLEAERPQPTMKWSLCSKYWLCRQSLIPYSKLSSTSDLFKFKSLVVIPCKIKGEWV